MTNIYFDISREEWDAFLGRGGGAFSHFYNWTEVLASVYDLPVFRLAARTEQGGEIAGILPLLLFSAPGKARRLISLPYTDSAGILADDPQTAERLLAAGLELTADRGAAHLELRQGQGGIFPASPAGHPSGFRHAVHSFKVGLARPLPDTVEALWDDLSPKVRNQVRKARRSGCGARVGGAELVGDFYAVFSENMRDLGSPVHAPELFRRVAKTLPSRIVVVDIDREPAAAAMVFLHNRTLFNPWASSLRRHRPRCPNMLLYWTMLAHGVECGCRRFDFGRSTPNAPTCRFKQQWGAEMSPLAWHVFSNGTQVWNPQDESLTDEAWKSLDLASSRCRGPAIRRWISL